MSSDQIAAAAHTAPAGVDTSIAATQKKLAEETRQFLNENRLQDAEKAIRQSLALARSATPLAQLGLWTARTSGLQAAMPFYAEALSIDPANAIAHTALADAYYQMDDVRCLAHVAMAMKAAPENRSYRENFVICLSRFARPPLQSAQPAYDAAIRDAVHTCLEKADIQIAPMKYLWLMIFSNDPAFARFYKTVISIHPDTTSSVWANVAAFAFKGQKEKYEVFDQSHFDRQKDLSVLATPFFLGGLRHLQIPSLPFEKFLTALRQRLLADLSAASKAETTLALAAALAVYCGETEYIFDKTDAEEKQIAALRQTIETARDLQLHAADVAVYACYAPLHALSNAEDLLLTFENHPQLGTLVAADIGDFKRMQRHRQQLESMSGFDNDISIRVRAQYEESPYPHWAQRPSASLESIATARRGTAQRVLVAGCGTGQEAAMAAASYPHAVIDAIDLSSSSLAYAAMRAEDFGIQNIRFRHGDILHLDFPDACFDIITSSGVLHHMEDPAAGWRSLLRCLKPDGMMRIALYSDMARRHIAVAQKIIAENKIPATPDGIRAFRRDAAQILPYATYQMVTRNSSDFYHLSSLRDLLFHVQEHRMTWPQIGEIMQSLGLELAHVNVNGKARHAYRQMFSQPGTQDIPDTIQNWHKFEQAHPDTFAGMYQFWCRRAR